MLNYYFQSNSNVQSQTKQPEPMPATKKLAQAYVPEQKYEDLYTPEQAIMQGTIFKQLDMPYKKKR